MGGPASKETWEDMAKGTESEATKTVSNEQPAPPAATPPMAENTQNLNEVVPAAAAPDTTAINESTSTPSV